MYSRTQTTPSIKDCSDKLQQLKAALADADAVLVGAGAGLSTAAGFLYSGERFHAHFEDFIQKYGFSDMYSGGFYPFDSPEENWAYWSRYVYINRYQDAPKPVYEWLYRLVKDKDYFVLTTNVDHCFQKVGFDKQRLFYTQGDYGLYQCSTPCHDRTYDNEESIRRMYAAQRDMRVPAELLPSCPRCGAPMIMNLRADHRFVEDAGWHAAAERYRDFAAQHAGKRLLLLELGVGGNTPGIIKYPFWKTCFQNPRATYACINKGEAVCPREIAARSLCIDADIGEALEALLG